MIFDVCVQSLKYNINILKMTFESENTGIKKVCKYCFKSLKKQFDKWLLMAEVFNRVFFLIWLIFNSGTPWPTVGDSFSCC